MAKWKYTELIDSYCKTHGFAVPPGFYRRAASPLAVVRMDLSPPQLVARTWFNREDVIYYVEHLVITESDTRAVPCLRILDFKAREELDYSGGKRLKKKGNLGP